jgi:hypothetical protein
MTRQIVMHFLRIMLAGEEILFRVMEEHNVIEPIWVSAEAEAR